MSKPLSESIRGWVQCVFEFGQVRDAASLVQLEANHEPLPGAVKLWSELTPEIGCGHLSWAAPERVARRAALLLLGAAAPDKGPPVVQRVWVLPLGAATIQDAGRAADTITREAFAKLGIPLNGEGGPVLTVAEAWFGWDAVIDGTEDRMRIANALATARAATGCSKLTIEVVPFGSGVFLSARGFDPNSTFLLTLVRETRKQVQEAGATITRQRVVGLIPRSVAAAVLAEAFDPNAPKGVPILENALEERGITSFARRLAMATPSPGGGAAAARAVEHAAALLAMVSGITLGRLKGENAARAPLALLRERSLEAMRVAQSLESRDEAAFEAFLEASRLARADPAAGNERALEQASQRVTEVPLELMEATLQVFALLDEFLDLAQRHQIRVTAEGDLGAAVELLQTAARIASINVKTNLASVRPEAAAHALRERHQALEFRGETTAGAARDRVRRQLGS